MKKVSVFAVVKILKFTTFFKKKILKLSKTNFGKRTFSARAALSDAKGRC